MTHRAPPCADNGWLADREQPEVRLYRAVLTQALMDATGRATQSVLIPMDIEHARRWIEEGGKKFQAVCFMAGWDPDFVHRRLCELLREFDATGLRPAALVHGNYGKPATGRKRGAKAKAEGEGMHV